MKYIMFENKHGMKFPIIFPDTFVHKQIEEKIREMDPTLSAISAGFITTKSTCFGKSESLGNMKSRETDCAFIDFNDSIGAMGDTLFELSALSEVASQIMKTYKIDSEE